MRVILCFVLLSMCKGRREDVSVAQGEVRWSLLAQPPSGLLDSGCQVWRSSGPAGVVWMQPSLRAPC